MTTRLILAAVLACGLLGTTKAAGPPFSVQDVPKDGQSIVLDGQVGEGEWNGTTLEMSFTHGQTRVNNADDGELIPCEVSGVCNGDPLTVSIQYAWDDTSLYYLVEETTIDDDPTTGITAGDWCDECTNLDAKTTAAAPWSTDSVGFYTTGIKWTPDSDIGETYNTTEMGPLIQPWVGLIAEEDLIDDFTGEPQYRHLSRVVTQGFGESTAQLIGPEHEPFNSYIVDLENRWDLSQPQSAFGVTEDGRRVAEMFMRWDQLFYDLNDPDDGIDGVQDRLASLEATNPGVTQLLNTDAVQEGLEFRMDPLLVDGTDDFSFGGQTHPEGNLRPQADVSDEFSDISVIRLTAATGAVEDICGDFDRDGDVDSADRTIQTTNWTGALPPGDPNATKTFEQGDCDADGDVDTADQNGTITNWTGAMNAGNLQDGDDADLLYDPATGAVILDAEDTSSGMFISFVLGTGANNMRPENLVKSADGSAGPFFDVGTNTDATTFQIGQTDPLNQGAGPQIDLGNIFPAGIASKEELAEYLTLAEYASELGQGGTFDLQLVPEPSGLALALIGMLGFVVRSRRR